MGLEVGVSKGCVVGLEGGVAKGCVVGLEVGVTKGCVKLQNMLRIKQADSSGNLKILSCVQNFCILLIKHASA